MTDDVRKLLGGYATGTLTGEEKKVLFEAALQDDKLFAALADEHALKDLLDDSAVRAQLLQATEDPRFSIMGALREWFAQPKSKALTATGAVLLALIGINQVREPQREAAPVVAELRRPAPAPSASQAPVQNEANSQAPASSADAQTSPPVEPPKREESAQTSEKQTSGKEVREQARQTAPATQAAAPPPPPPAPAAAPATTAPAETATAAEQVAAGPRGGAVGAVAGGMLGDGMPAARRAANAAGSGSGASSAAPLRYQLLRREAAGNFEAVPPDYLFVPGDLIRLRVTSAQEGAVGVSTNASSSTVSRAVPAGAATDVPQSGGIAITAATTRLVVVLAPSPAPTSSLLEGAASRAKRSVDSTVSLEIPIRQKRP